MSRTVLAFGTGGLRLAKDAALAAAAGLLPEEAGADFLCFHGRETDAAWQELRRLADRYEVARGLIGGPRLTFRRVQTGSALPEAEPDSRVLRQALLGSPDAQPAWTGLAGWYLSEGKAAAEALPETEEVLVCGAVHETDGCVPLRLLQRILPRACGGLLLLPWRDPADGRLEKMLETAKETLDSLELPGAVELVGLPAGEWLPRKSEAFCIVDLLAGLSWHALLTGEEAGVHAWQLPLEHTGWQDFGSWSAALTKSWGISAAEAAVLNLSLGPALHERFTARGKGLALQRSPEAPWFRNAGNRPDGWWEEQDRQLDALAFCKAGCLRALRDMTASLPAGMRINPQTEADMARAGQACRKWLEADTLRRTLTGAQAELEEKEGGAVHRKAGSVLELDRVTSDLAKQEKLTEALRDQLNEELIHLDSQGSIRLMKRMQYGLRRAIAQEARTAAEKRELVRRAESYPEEKQNRAGIDRTLAEAAQLSTHLEWLRMQAETVQSELRWAYQHAVKEPEDRPEAAAGPLPENCFFASGALMAVSAAVLEPSTAGRRMRQRQIGDALDLLPELTVGVSYPSVQSLMKALSRRGKGYRGSDPLRDCLAACRTLIREGSDHE